MASTQASHLSILIADDSATSRIALRGALEQLGHDCLAAENGIEAWELFKSSGADVVISDRVMPRMDGIELCRKVREDPEALYTYFILLSSLEESQQVLEGMHAGADDYLTKPLDRDQLEMRLIAASRVTALHRRIAEQQQKIQNEVEMAASIQHGLLPERPPRVEGAQVAGRCTPAADIGGDLYDFVPGGDGRLFLVVADVAGHSIGSALLMAMSRSVIRGEIAEGRSPAAVLEAANRALYRDLVNAGLFVTAFCSAYDPAARTLSYANAGHNPPLVRRTAGDLIELVEAGAAIGILAEERYAESLLELAPGDLVLLYTDGVVEASAPDGEPFGEQRLKQLVAEVEASPSVLADSVFRAVRRHAREMPQQDDVTLVALKLAADGGPS